MQKNFREASKLFESINFQRKAIDLLEFNGFIEDAAKILLRMKVPYRAAIIYDRNGQFVRAAECFALDGKHDSAARSFEKAAGADYHFFKNAGQAFLTAGMTDNALEVYGKILQSQDVLKIGFGSQKYEFLAVYMANPYNAKYVLENVTSEQLAAFIESLGLRPDFVQNMSVWVLYRHDLKFFDSILFKLNGHEELAALFWSHISGPYANYLHQS
ncbi:MAG: hypothetical protein H7249_19115, partial [Chitinophagaceae bacterium]|nr:hypothetical protein [Oligoflexus sp.]